MLTTYGGVGAADQPPPAGHVRFAPELDLALAGGGLAVSDAGGLQACFASTDGWCTALYDADTNGVVDLSDAARFSAYAALAQAPQALAQTTLAPTSLTQTTLAQTSLTGTLAGLTAPLAAPPAGGDQPPPDLTPLQSRFRNPFLWTGQRYDPATQLYHFWARSYDPNTGRFLQEDMQGILATVGLALSQEGSTPSIWPPATVPLPEQNGNPNLFLYAGCNPLRFTDSLGLDWDDDVDDAIGDYFGERAAAAGAVDRKITMGINIASTVGYWALSLMPYGGAIILAGKLAAGEVVTWDDLLLAAGSLPGGQYVYLAVEVYEQVTADHYDPHYCIAGVGRPQVHHWISARVFRALSRHPTLRGLYGLRDGRFTSQAKTYEAHKGYQQWHRDYDARVVQWIEQRKQATAREFERFLQSIYRSREMTKRFFRRG